MLINQQQITITCYGVSSFNVVSIALPRGLKRTTTSLYLYDMIFMIILRLYFICR